MNPALLSKCGNKANHIGRQNIITTSIINSRITYKQLYLDTFVSPRHWMAFTCVSMYVLRLKHLWQIVCESTHTYTLPSHRTLNKYSKPHQIFDYFPEDIFERSHHTNENGQTNIELNTHTITYMNISRNFWLWWQANIRRWCAAMLPHKILFLVPNWYFGMEERIYNLHGGHIAPLQEDLLLLYE